MAINLKDYHTNYIALFDTPKLELEKNSQRKIRHPEFESELSGRPPS